MGLLQWLNPNRRQTAKDVSVTRTALQEANAPNAESRGAVTRLIGGLLGVGIDGKGPFASAAKVAGKALRNNRNHSEKAIDDVVSKHVRGGAAGGFVTSVGGFITMPVAIPANVFEFYVQATRMVAGVALLRGYDIKKDEIRTAVLLTLIGNDAKDALRDSGLPVGALGGGMFTSLLTGRLPKSALMVVNKAVGFRVLRSAGQSSLARLGRLVPVAGGVLGGALDGWLMKRIGKSAKREFPKVS